MSTMTENVSPTNDGSPSWLKQRSSIFNDTNNNKSVPKVVDKELARLKNIGAVSSVWSNKFVQEDNPGGTTDYNKRNSPPLPTNPNEPLSPRQKRFMPFDISPRPNANYNPGITNRVVSPPPTSPRSSVNSLRSSRTLSGSAKKFDDIQAEDKNNIGYFSKSSTSSLYLDGITNDTGNDKEEKDNNRSSVTSSIISSVPSSPTTTVTNVTTARSSTTTTEKEKATITAPATSHSPSNSTSSNTTSIDEAASLWFQCETLKTQYAQSNARLNRANEDIEFYKRQLEQQGEISRQDVVNAVAEKEKESFRVRQLAEFIVKQDQLLNEYEINLHCLTRLTNESAYLKETQAEMDNMRQELIEFSKQKELMEGAITSLKAELEMSYSQMRLMMVVSTEIQNEFDSYKEKMDMDIKEILSKKQAEHETELLAVQEKLNKGEAETAERAVGDQDVAAKIALATAAADATAATVAADNEKALSSLRDQVADLTDALEEKVKAVAYAMQVKDQALAEAIEAVSAAHQEKEKAVSRAFQEKQLALYEAHQEKEAAISALENQLKSQKMTMDAQLMMLNQTILEKDNLLMEFMSGRNNSREVISAAASMSSPTSIVPSATVTDTFYHPHASTEARFQMAQVRDYMYSSSDDEEEDESEVLRMSYSSDEEEQQVEHQHTQQLGHYHHMMNNNNDNHSSSSPQSPADTVASSISFDSDEEEEKVAEIKHFSYSSVQSQATRPVSLLSTTESLSGGLDFSNNDKIPTTEGENNRNSATTTFSVAKETANWPMPPPTPPPSEPLPPVPVLRVEKDTKEEQKATNPTATSIVPPPPRRARSKTMARDEAPNMNAYTTSVHQTNELPRIIPLQKTEEDATTPVAPPRKDLPTLNTHTKWMDDPESSEEDEELWSEAIGTPKQQSLQQEWNI